MIKWVVNLAASAITVLWLISMKVCSDVTGVDYIRTAGMVIVGNYVREILRGTQRESRSNINSMDDKELLWWTDRLGKN